MAAVEQRLNDSDMFYARDMGLAWEVTDFIFRVGTTPENWKSFWKGEDGITPLPFNTKIRLEGDTGGGSSGNVFTTDDFSNTHSATIGGPNKWESASMGHEVAHGINVGHGSSVNDTMSGSESALGAGTVQRMLEQLELASAVSAPAITYGDDLAPYAMEDFGSTTQGQPFDLNLLENDYDGNGDAIHISYVDLTSEAGGSITDLGNGVVRYTPAAGHLGVDRFRYFVADEGGIENRGGVVKIYTRNSGLANHWIFDETSGTTFHDIGPYGNNGNSGTKTTSIVDGSIPGVIGNAYQNFVEGAQSKTSATFDTGDPMDGDLSVSMFFKLDALPSKNYCILSKGAGMISGRIDKIRGGWEIAVVNGKFYFACKQQSDLERTNQAATLAGNSEIQTGQWYHLAMTMDRANHELKAWIDGVPVTTSPTGNTVIPDGFIENYYPLSLLNCAVDDHSFPAAVDDLRLYNSVFSDSDVAELQSGTAEIPAGAPSPSNGLTSASALSQLKWIPGKTTGYEFDVYFGTNATAVANATPSSPEYLGRVATPTSSPALNILTTYYWRVDEVTSNGTIVPGALWNFTTKESLEYVFDNGGGDGIWSNPSNWNPDGAPVVANDYEVNGVENIYAPGLTDNTGTISYSFEGKSLSLRDGATLNLEVISTKTVEYDIPNLSIENGMLRIASERNYNAYLNSSVEFLGDSEILLAAGNYNRQLSLTDGMSGSGTMRLYRNDGGSGRILHLQGGDFSGYSGDWTLFSFSEPDQVMNLVCNTSTGWGTGDMNLGNYSLLELQSSYTSLDSVLRLADEASVNISSWATIRLGGLEGSGSISTLNNTKLLVGQNHENAEFSGVITGSGSFTKEGVGTLILSGDNSYTGTTNIAYDDSSSDEDATPTLRVDGSLASGVVNVTGSTALSGNGNIVGTVNLTADAYLKPGGDEIGTLTLDSVPNLSGTTVIRLDRSASQTSDKLVLSDGTLAFGGALRVSRQGVNLQAGDTFTLFEASAYSGAFTSVDLPALNSGLAWDISQLGVNGTIQVMEVTVMHTLSYGSVENGSVTGVLEQTVTDGSDGSEVTAVPDSGYRFTSWSDGSAVNPRTDTDVESDLSVIANFELDINTFTVTGGNLSDAANWSSGVLPDGSYPGYVSIDGLINSEITDFDLVLQSGTITRAENGIYEWLGDTDIVIDGATLDYTADSTSGNTHRAFRLRGTSSLTMKSGNFILWDDRDIVFYDQGSVTIEGGTIDARGIVVKPDFTGGAVITFAEGNGTVLLRSTSSTFEPGSYIDFLGGSEGTLTVTGADKAWFEALYAAGNLRVDGDYTGSFDGLFVVDGDTIHVDVSTRLRCPDVSPSTLITVDYKNIETSAERDWIGIYEAGADDDAFLTWKRTDGTANGTVTFDARVAGNYEARLFADNGYTLLASIPFTVAIDAEYQNYVATRTLLVGVDAEPDSQPFGDGVSNLVKYAFGLELDGRDARVLEPEAGTSGLPYAEVLEAEDGGHDLRITFVRRFDSELQYIAEVSQTLTGDGWSPLVSSISVTPIDATWERVVYQQHYGAEAQKGFIRMRVQW